MPAAVRSKIKKYGMRNVTTLSIAPNGSISMIPECVGGIEPLSAKAYLRKDDVSNRIYVHPIYKKLLLSGEKVPDWFVDSHDLLPEDHLKTQVVIQKMVDGGVSKTLSLPKDTKEEQLSALMIEYIVDLKGITAYRDGSRGEQPINKLTEEETREILKTQEVS